MKHKFLVEVDADLSWADTRDFVMDALSSWGGQYFPGNDEQDADPRFAIKEADVKIKHYRRPTKWPKPPKLPSPSS
jgi:hypothetical protein